jgi:hypothetical protein
LTTAELGTTRRRRPGAPTTPRQMCTSGSCRDLTRIGTKFSGTGFYGGSAGPLGHGGRPVGLHVPLGAGGVPLR